MRTNKKLIFILSIVFISSYFISGCGKNNDEIGVGPVKNISIGRLDKSLSETGKNLFETKCFTCHRIEAVLMGPPLKGITKKRKPEWIMNMILNPEQMIKENKYAKELYSQYRTQMTYQNLSEDDARAILEYFRLIDN